MSDSQGNYSYLTASNRLTQATGATVTTDAAGNITANGAFSYLYNNAGHLQSASQSGSTVGSYAYNANRQRTRKSTISDTTVYHYDLAGNLILETTSEGIPLVAYVYADSTPLAQINHNGTTETLSYLHTDYLNTPRLATNTSAVKVWFWEGRAFGDTNPNQNPDGDTITTTVNLRYPGQYRDGESGLFYNWNRYYSPQLGRYLTSDPIGLAGGLNTYGYVKNNPLKWTDPTGLDIYRCRRGLGRQPDERMYGRAFQHWYSCVTLADGKTVCGGQTYTDNPFDSPGRPTTPEEDYYDPKACSPAPDSNQCYENCLTSEWSNPRPNYSIVWGLGTHCQEYDIDVHSKCRAACGIK